MVDRRLSRRVLFRRKARFGSSDLQFSGYTSNISENGVRIESHRVLPSQSKVVVYIYISGNGLEDGRMDEVIKLEGIVAWVSPTLPGIISKMGIKFSKGMDDTKFFKDR
jgi:PilZ domain.